MDTPASHDVERLLQERAWLRRVALALVHSEDRADDLTQDAYLAVLERAPSHVERPRGWLGAVLRNLWRNDLRAASRRRARETAHSPPGREVPSPPELVERAELVERLGRLLLALREPYRTTLLLRYFEDLSPQDVARRMDVPVETVRTRVKRALAELAEGLDAERGGRRAWAPAMLAWASRADVAAAGTVVGAVLMKKVVVAACAALLLVGGWGLFRGWFDPRSRDESGGRELAADGRSPAAADDQAPSLLGAASPPRAAQPDVPLGAFTLSGRVIDRAGRSVSGVPVRLTRALDRWQIPFADAPPLDREPPARAVLAVAQSDADGAFTLTGLVHGVRYEAEAVPAAPRYGSAAVAEVWPWAQPRVVLVVGDGVPVRGRVVDGAGRGVQAWVEGHEPYALGPSRTTAGRWRAIFQRTDAEGRFDLPAVPEGFVLLSAVVPGLAARRTLPVRAPREDVILRIEEPGGATVAGRVTDDAGRPLPGVRVAVESLGRRFGPVSEGLTAGAVTDADGAFRATGLIPDRIQQIDLEAPGYVVPRLFGHATPLAAGATTTVDVVLTRGGAIEGEVADDAGRPIAGATVRAQPELPPPHGTYYQPWTTVTAATGRFRLDSLPRLPLLVEAELEGYASARSEGVLPAASAVRLVLRGEEAATARGIVRRADEGQAPRTLVTAVPTSAGAEPTGAGTRYATTTADGSFVVSLDRTRAWRVAANAPGFASEPQTLAPGGAWPEITFVLRPQPALRGRVLTRSGAPVPDAKMRCVAREGPGAETTTALDGGFSFEGLTAGTYDIEALDPLGQRGATARVEWRGDADIPPLVLRTEELQVLGGTVVDAAGTPVAGRMITLGGFGNGPYDYSGADGRFDFWLFAKGEHALGIQTEMAAGTYATGRTDHRVIDVIRPPTLAEVVLLTPDGQLAQGGQIWFRTGRSRDGQRTSGSGAQGGGGRFRVELEPDVKDFDVEVATLTDAAGRRLNVRPQTFRNLDPAKSPFTLRLEAGRVLRGRVLDGAGNGLAHMALLVAPREAFDRAHWLPSWAAGAEPQTGEDGAFEIVGLPEGELVAAPRAVEGFVEATPLLVRPGEDDVVLRLERGATLAGRLLDPDGQPIAGAQIGASLAERPGEAVAAGALAPSYVDRGWHGQTDASGAFTLAGIPVNARLFVRAEPPAPWLPTTAGDVAAGHADVVLRATTGVFVEGEVFGEGWSEDELEVVLAPPGQEDPRFALAATRTRVPAGQRRFRVGPVAPGSYDLAVYASSISEPLALERATRAPAAGLRLTLPNARHLVGRLVGENVKDFRIGVHFDTTNTGLSVDTTGRFRLRNARPGRVTVVAYREDDERYGLVEDADPTAGPIEVRLQQGMAIEGRVTGLPAGERVTLEVTANGPLASKSLRDVEGDRFRIVGLPPGKYALSVTCRAGKRFAHLTAEGVAAGGAEVVLAFDAR